MYMGKKNLEILRDRPEIYNELERKATKLEEGLRANVEKLGLNYTVNRAGSLVCLFFAEGPINNYDDVTKCNVPMFNRYFEELLNRGILLAPTQFEAMFLSNAHTDEIIDETIKASYEALKAAHNL